MKRSSLALAALTMVLGAQSMRVYLPALILHIGEGPVNPAVFALFAYGPFGLALAGPLLVRWLKPRGAVWVAGGGLIVFRLAEQLSTTNTMDLWAGIGATVCFLWLLPMLVAHGQVGGTAGWQTLALGLLLGLSLDSAVRGLTGTLDLSWMAGPGAWLAVAALLGLFGWSLWRATRDELALAGTGFRASLPLVGLGLLLFVEWQILQNQGYVTTLTGWPANAAFGWLMLANVAALLAASYALSNARLAASGWPPLLAGVGLTLALAVAQTPGWTFAVAEMVGVVSAGLLFTALQPAAAPAALQLAGAPASLPLAAAPVSEAALAAPRWNLRSFVPVWLGLVLFISLLFIYYMSFIVRLPPFPRAALAPLAGAGLAVCGVAAWRRARSAAPPAPDWTPARLGALLLLAPLAMLGSAALRPPQPAAAGGYPVRVMTYNIHSGYSEDGRQDMDTQAQVIASAGSDVVAVQEVSRGWVVSGATDDLALLADRLHMPYMAMGASTDPIFGDAIISRYPILASGTGDLPLLDTLIPRGYVWALIDVGAGQKLLVFTTHLEPGGADSVRVAQARALVQAWAAQPQTVILGDMNSVAGSPQMQVLLDAGLTDSWAEAGQGPRPEVDWIFHTPDLAASAVAAIDSPASDHPAVVASVAPAR